MSKCPWAKYYTHSGSSIVLFQCVWVVVTPDKQVAPCMVASAESVCVNADLCYKALRVVDYKSAIERQLIYYLPFFSCAHILCVFHRMIKFLWHRINPAKLAVILCAEAALLFFFLFKHQLCQDISNFTYLFKSFQRQFLPRFFSFWCAPLSLLCCQFSFRHSSHFGWSAFHKSDWVYPMYFQRLSPKFQIKNLIKINTTTV